MATVNGKQMSMAPREEDLQELEELLRDMHKRVDDAHADGRVYMMGQYARMVALISPEISRIQLRFKRESLASFRKEHADLKAQFKAEKKAAEEAAAQAVRNSATQ